MTNKEKYKQAFSVLQTSENFSLEVEKMAKLNKRKTYRSIAVAAAICLLLIGGTGTAYAANVGGMQRTLQLWIHGDQTEVTVDFNSDGSYSMKYTDAEGNVKESGGGGVAYDIFGRERPLTEEELIEQLSNNVDVTYSDDGTVTLYFQDQIIDLTNKFKDNVCYVLLNGDNCTLYVTIKYDNGWAASSNKYISPDSFN